MSKREDYCNAWEQFASEKHYYYNSATGTGYGCSAGTCECLRRAGIISASESFHAASNYEGVLADQTRFDKISYSADKVMKADILVKWGYHVATWAGDGYKSLYECAPEATHSLATNGTGCGLHRGHTLYNCGTGTYSWDYIYRIKEDDDLTVIDKIMAKADEIANDNSHGYNNTVGKNLGYPDYDCGAFVSACIRAAGLINSSTVFEPNQPDGTWGYDVILTAAGFTKMTFNASTVQRGDVLIKSGRHTELAYGNGKQIGAHNDYDGKSGDSSGNEISVVNLYTNYWEYMYRYNGTAEGHSTLQYGSTGSEVKTLQTLLNSHGASLDVDGSFGNLTKQAVISFQTANNLVVDGIVGNQTWSALEATPEPTKTLTAKERLQIAIEIIDGKWGSGSDRKQKLISAYGETEAVKIQNIVNTAF